MRLFLQKFLRQAKDALIFPVFNKPHYLLEQREIIKKKWDIEPKPPDTKDLNQLLSKVRQLWTKGGKEGLEKLSHREKRWLPWILYQGESPRIIEQKDLLEALLSILEKRKNSHLNSIIHVYLKNYEPSADSDVLRVFILKYLATYEGNIPRLKHWKDRIYLFYPNNLRSVVKMILSQREKPSIYLEKLGLVKDLSNCEFLKYITYGCLKEVEKNFPVYLEVLLDLLESPLDHTKPRFPEIIPKAATSLIPKVGVNISRQMQELLCSFFLKYMGDPRLPGGITRWSQVSEEAGRIFIQWLSSKDIQFFFEVVGHSAGDPKWRYRRKFWESYLSYIKNTWVVLGKRARNLVTEPEYRFGELRGASRDQSAFLIEMGNYVFVEWSHSGKCRVFKKDDFPLEFGLQYYHAIDIRPPSPEYSQIHYVSERYRWQDQLANWIRIDLGILPSKSYYLD